MPIVALPLRLPGIEHSDAGSDEIVDISGDDREIMNDRCRGDQRVGLRICVVRLLAVVDQTPPCEQDPPVDIQNARSEPRQDPVTKPGIQFNPKCRVGNALDPEFDFGDGYSGQIARGWWVPFGPGSYAAMAARPFPKLGNYVGIQQPRASRRWAATRPLRT